MSAEQAVPVKGREEPAAVTPPTLPPPEGKLRPSPSTANRSSGGPSTPIGWWRRITRCAPSGMGWGGWI